VTPEDKIWIWTKTEDEKNDWVKEITHRIKMKLGSKYGILGSKFISL
jgi:hypothetical protein